MEKIQIISIILSFSLIALITGFISMRFIGIKDYEAKNQARFECAQSSRYQTVDPVKNVTVWYPVKDLYEQCLKEKGL